MNAVSAWALAFGLLATIAGALLGLSAWGARRWARATLAMERALTAARTDAQGQSPTPAPTRYDPRELDGLPAPVQRYFSAVLKVGQPLITAARVDLAGHFNMATAGQRWKPFTSRQWVATRRPGFLWDARVSLLPGVPVRVVDSYIAGAGRLHAAVFGLFTVAQASGEGEIARGEFMRWFAETAWVPTALLPSQGVHWQAVDERSANATLTDGAITLTLLFSFDKAGLITSARAAARAASLGDEVVMLPWEGAWADYQPSEGMLLPMRGEAAWLRPQGRAPYFIGRVTALHFEFAT